ncbi:MAG: Ig-like domain-containing protein [Anaerolineaceae bacterium]
MNWHKRVSVLAFALLLLAGIFGSVSAQSEEPYRVSLRRDFGYGNGADIQGNMTLRLVGNEDNVTRVTFLMDEQTLVSLETPPYSFSFTTDNYPSGIHKLTARVETKDDQIFSTKALTYRFLTAEQANSGVKDILIPILGVVAIVFAVSMLGQFKSDRKMTPTDGQPKVYGGLYGGAVCPKCGHPFQRSVFGMNLVARRLERCPACGKFVMTTQASAAQLAAAEEIERAKVTGWSEPLEEKDKTVDQLEESKYIDSDDDSKLK